MKKTIRSGIFILIILLLTLNCSVVAQAMTSLQSAEGVIVVIGHNAMVNIDGTDYFILKENAAYAQFENRHIKMYNVRIGYLSGYLIIDFTGFRLMDALA
jgi:hypothetical protein